MLHVLMLDQTDGCNLSGELQICKEASPCWEQGLMGNCAEPETRPRKAHDAEISLRRHDAARFPIVSGAVKPKRLSVD